MFRYFNAAVLLLCATACAPWNAALPIAEMRAPPHGIHEARAGSAFSAARPGSHARYAVNLKELHAADARSETASDAISQTTRSNRNQLHSADSHDQSVDAGGPGGVAAWVDKIEAATELSGDDRREVAAALAAIEDDSLRGMFVAQYLMQRTDSARSAVAAQPSRDAEPADSPASIGPEVRVADVPQEASSSREQAAARQAEANRIRNLISQELARQGLGGAAIPNGGAAAFAAGNGLPGMSQAIVPSLEATAAAMLAQEPASSVPRNAASSHFATSVSAPSSGAAVAQPDISQDWRDSLSASIARLDAQLSNPGATPDDRERLEAAKALLHAVLGDANNAVRAIESATGATRSFWTEEVIALAELHSPDGHGDGDTIKNASALSATRGLRRAARSLGQSAPLDVRSLAFASQVDGFGLYTLFNRGVYEFRGGEHVLLYVEIENFQSTPTAAEMFHTSLEARYVIFNEDQTQVAAADLGGVEDDCRNYRHDFFIPFHLEIPSSLPAGRYTLELRVTDLSAGKQGDASISFRIKP